MAEETLMVGPQDFTVGRIDRASGFTLVFPRTKYEYALLVTKGDEGRVAVVLSGNDAFSSFNADGSNHAGLLVPNVTLEVDPRSACDIQHTQAPTGTLVRAGSTLSISTKSAGHLSFRSLLIPLVAGLAELPANQAAGFSSWQVVLGTGIERRVLFSILTEESGGT